MGPHFGRSSVACGLKRGHELVRDYPAKPSWWESAASETAWQTFVEGMRTWLQIHFI